MLHGSAWVARRDRPFASVEYPQQRRRSEFAARIPVMAAQVASEVTAAVAAEVKAAVTAALQAALAELHGGLDLAPMTTSTPMASVADDHDLILVPATTPTTATSVSANYEPTATLTYSPSATHISAVPLVASTPASMPIMSVISDLALAAPITCSTECPGRANGATRAMAAPSASMTTSSPVVHEDGIHLPTSCNEREPDLSMPMPGTLDIVEQQLVCSSYVDRPLAFVVGRDVLDDHNFVTDTYAMPLTRAALGVHDGSITNEHHRPHSVSIKSVSLFQCDPGEKTRASRDLAISQDIALDTCVKQLNADFLDNYDHHQQSRYRVIAVVSLILLVMCNEALLWPFLQSATGHMIQLLPWDPGQPFYGMGTKLTTASGVICLQENSVQELFFCSAEVDTITKCKMTLAELQPWPSWESSFLVLTVYLGNWNVELVQLQPWPSWKFSLSILTWLECFCDILFCTDSEVNWTNQTVFNNDGCWCGPMQPVYPNLISATNLFFRALPGHFHMWLMLWRTTEDSIIRSQLHGGLPRLMWFIGNLMLLSIAPENSGLVTYLHSRGLPATDEVDCVALIMTLVVSDASTYPDFSFSSFGIVAIDSPGLDEGQARNMLLVVCVAWPLDLEHFSSANHYVQPLRPTTVRYEGSIEKRITVLPQILARTVQALLLLSWSQSCCTGFNFFITNQDLLVGGNESNYSALMPWQVYFCGSAFFPWKLPCACKISSVCWFSLSGDITQCCSQLLQWIIAWPLYPAPRQPWFSYCTTGKVALHHSEPLQGNIQQPEIARFQLLTVKLSYSVTVSYIRIAGLFGWAQPFGNFHCMIILRLQQGVTYHLGFQRPSPTFHSMWCCDRSGEGFFKHSMGPWWCCVVAA